MHTVKIAAKQRELKGESFAEYRIVLDDGIIRRIHEYSRTTYDTNHCPIQVNGIIIDITGCKLEEHALEESEARYRSLFKNNRAVMMLINPKSSYIVDANNAACKYYGWSHEEITGKKIFHINTLSRGRNRN